MGKTYIFGHKNPDTDSITSSLVMANLEKALGNEDVTQCNQKDRFQLALVIGIFVKPEV